MNLKTEPEAISGQNEPKSFTNTFLVQISVLALLAVLVMIFAERLGLSTYRRSLTNEPFLLTWIGAINSISWLDEPGLLPLSNRIIIFSSMLLSFIVFPTVFLFGWRSRRLDRAHGVAAPLRSLGMGSIAYVFSMIATMFMVITIGPVTVFQQARYVSSCENNNARLLRYNVQHEIDVLTASAFQYRILPKAEGGGGGSYLGYGIPDTLARTDVAEYTAQVSADTVSYVAESAFCETDRMTVKLDPNGKTPVWLMQGNWGSG
jgi:hypothetical protein